jgi:hypothetical protein
VIRAIIDHRGQVVETVDQLLDRLREEAAERIARFVDVTMTELDNPYIQPGHELYPGGPTEMNGHPITACNIYDYNVLEKLGVPMGRYYTIGGKYYTPVNAFFDAMTKNARELTYKYAQGFANQGVPVVIIQPAKGTDEGHVALVYPSDTVQDDKTEIEIIGAGSALVFGRTKAQQSFYQWPGYDPKFFWIP